MQKIRRKIAFLSGPHKEAVIPKPPRAGAGSQGQGPCPSPVRFTATSSRREYCRRALRRAVPACSSFSLSFDASVFVIESTRRRVAVEATLENRGENAYSTVLNISFSRNLQFASLIPKVRHRGCAGSPCSAGEPKTRAQNFSAPRKFGMRTGLAPEHPWPLYFGNTETLSSSKPELRSDADEPIFPSLFSYSNGLKILAARGQVPVRAALLQLRFTSCTQGPVATWPALLRAIGTLPGHRSCPLSTQPYANPLPARSGKAADGAEPPLVPPSDFIPAGGWRGPRFVFLSPVPTENCGARRPQSERGVFGDGFLPINRGRKAHDAR